LRLQNQPVHQELLAAAAVVTNNNQDGALPVLVNFFLYLSQLSYLKAPQIYPHQPVCRESSTPSAPMIRIISRIRSFLVTYSCGLPLNTTLIVSGTLNQFSPVIIVNAKSVLPIPVENAPSAPCVQVYADYWSDSKDSLKTYLVFLFVCYNNRMAKIDEIKELLNTLRVVLSLLFGAIVLLVGSTVDRLEANKLDIWTWISIVGIFLLLIALLMIFIKISKRTKEIKDL